MPATRQEVGSYLDVLEGQVAALKQQLEESTSAQAIAEVRAASAEAKAQEFQDREGALKAEATHATESLAAATRELESVRALASSATTAIERATTAEAVAAELRLQLQRKAVDDATVLQALEVARATSERPVPGPADFDIIIQRGSDGLLQKLTVKEKG